MRQLRGDFVVAYLLPDHSEFRLYKPINSTIPLFWQQERDVLRWSTDPLSLFRDSRPRIEDVDTELLPMLITEAGFPHHRSWFAGMRRLPTGECLSVSAHSATPVLSFFDEFRSESDPPATVNRAAGELRHRIAKACARMLDGTDSTVVLLRGHANRDTARSLAGQARDARSSGEFSKLPDVKERARARHPTIHQ